jgi:hypothetical protein
VALTQLGTERFQFVTGGLAFPVRLKGEFQLALRADAGKTEVVCGDHACLYPNDEGNGSMVKKHTHEVKWSYFNNQ